MSISTTHVGSLPFVSVAQAVDFTHQFDIPCLFTLPKLNPNEYMGADLLYLLGGEIDPRKKPVGLEPFHLKAFLDKLIVPRIKYQMIGPVTLEKIRQRKITVQERDFLVRTYRATYQSLKKYAEVFFVLDEPAVVNKEQLDSLADFIQQLEIEPENLGLHFCGKVEELRHSLILKYHSQLDLSLYELESLPALSFIGLSAEIDGPKLLKNCVLKESLIIAPCCGLAHAQIDTVNNSLTMLANIKSFLSKASNLL